MRQNNMNTDGNIKKQHLMSILSAIDGSSESMFLSDMCVQEILLDVERQNENMKASKDNETVKLSMVDVAQLIDMDGGGGLCFQELLQEKLLAENKNTAK